MSNFNSSQDSLEADEIHGSYSSLDSAGSDTSVDSSLSVTDNLAQVESDLFEAICSESRTGLAKIFKTANPAVVLRALVHFAYKNEDGRFSHDPEALHDAHELLGEKTSPLNIIQCACFLGEEDLALDILMYVDTESEHMEARKILYEFMGKVWGNGNTSLHLASFLGMSDLVNLMLNLGSNTNKRNDRKYKPVDCADDDATRALFLNVTEVSRSAESVARGVEEDIPRERSSSLDRNQQLKSIQLRLLQDDEQNSRRHQKAASDSYSGGSKSKKPYKGKSNTLDSLVKESSSEHIDFCPTPPRKRRDHVTFDPLTLLADAAATGDLLLLRDILDRENSNLTVNSPTENKQLTPLHLAATHNHLALCKFLISRGALVNAVDVEGWTPLHCAATESNAVIVKYLCEEVDNVDLDGTNADDDTPMDAAEDAEVKRIIADAITRRGSRPRSQSRRSLSSDEAISSAVSVDESVLSRKKSDPDVSENGDFSPEANENSPRSATRRELLSSPRLRTHEVSNLGTPSSTERPKRAIPVSILKGAKRAISQPSPGNSAQPNFPGNSISFPDVHKTTKASEFQSPKAPTEAVNKSENGATHYSENMSIVTTKTEPSMETKIDFIPSPVRNFPSETDVSKPSGGNLRSRNSHSPTVPRLSIPSPSTVKPRSPNRLHSPRSQRQADGPQSPTDSRSSQIPIRKGNSRRNITEGHGEGGREIDIHTITSNEGIGKEKLESEIQAPNAFISGSQVLIISTDDSQQPFKNSLPSDASAIPTKSPTAEVHIKTVPRPNVRISTEKLLTHRGRSNSTNALTGDPSSSSSLSSTSSGSADSVQEASTATTKRPHRKSFSTKDKPCLSPKTGSSSEIGSAPAAPRSASFKSLCEKFDSPLPERHPAFSGDISIPSSNSKTSPLSIRKIFSRS